MQQEGHYGHDGPVFVFFLVAVGHYLCLPPHQLELHLWDSLRHQVLLQCWFDYDRGVLGHWCLPVHQNATKKSVSDRRDQA